VTPKKERPRVAALSETTFAVQDTAGGGRHQPYRCTVNMYLLCMCWRRVGTVKTGRDRAD